MTKQADILTEQRERVALSKCQTSRERLMLLLSLKAGLRAKEIALLSWADYDVDAGKLRLRRTKGEKFRVVPVNADLAKAFEEYRADRGSKAVGNVFASTHANKGADLTPNAVAAWLRDFYTRRCGWKGFSSHSGRRTFVTRCARKVSMAGGSIRDVQALAGHADVQTTMLYVATDPDAQAKLVNLI